MPNELATLSYSTDLEIRLTAFLLAERSVDQLDA